MRNKKNRNSFLIFLVCIMFVLSLVYPPFVFSVGETETKAVGFLFTALISSVSVYNLVKTLINIGESIKAIKTNFKLLLMGLKIHSTTLTAEELAYANLRFSYMGYSITQIISSSFALGLLSATYAVAGDALEETPLPDTKYCSLCNWDPYTICTRERCEILGNCYYQPLETETGGICLPQQCEEGIPKITKIKAVFYNGTQKLLEKENRNCPNEFGGCTINIDEINYDVIGVNISFETNINASCGYSFDPLTPFEETELLSDNELYFPLEHEATIVLTQDNGFERGKTHQIFIKCRSTCDDGIPPASFDENYLKFKIQAWPDWIPPEVKLDPENGIVSEERRYQTIYIYLDKKGSCGYSTNHEKLNLTDNFDLDRDCSMNMEIGEYMCHFGTKLEGDFIIDSGCEVINECWMGDRFVEGECTKCWINVSLDPSKAVRIDWDEITAAMQENQEAITSSCNPNEINQQINQEISVDVDIGATMCSYFDNAENFNAGIMEGVKNNLFPLKFKCANEDGYMTEPVLYAIVTMPGYDIIVERPFEGYSTYFRNLDVVVKTKRNDNLLPSICKFSLDENKDYDNMNYIECKDSDCISISDTHYGVLENLSNGDHTLYIKCRDVFGLQEETKVNFKIIPAPQPKIIRIWGDGNKLFIETNVPSNCVYSYNETLGCNYNVYEAENMSKINDYLFNNYALKDKTYYIKCQDIWQDNPWPAECTAIVKPFELPTSAFGI